MQHRGFGFSGKNIIILSRGKNFWLQSKKYGGDLKGLKYWKFKTQVGLGTQGIDSNFLEDRC